MSVFLHEKLPIYRKALEFAIQVDRIALSLPRERWSLKDQIWRASTSIPLNIAEATGGLTDKQRLNHFRIARGSAAECSAAFDYIQGIGLIKSEELLYEEINNIGADLARLTNRYRR